MAATDDPVARVENLCQVLYVNPPSDATGPAEEELVSLSASSEYIPMWQQVLEKSKMGYAVFCGANALAKLMTDHWTDFNEEEKMDIRGYILNYLANRGVELEPFVVSALVKLLCRVTKLGWFDEGGKMRDIVTEAERFMEPPATVDHAVLGLRLLCQLVTEMNYQAAKRMPHSQRKVAVSFRDKGLMKCFEIAITMLKFVTDGTFAPDNPMLEDQVLEQALSCCVKCLSFDFLGTTPDESSDEVSAIQLPVVWQKFVQNSETIRIFFVIYGGFANATDGDAAGGAGLPGGPPPLEGVLAPPVRPPGVPPLSVSPERASEALEVLTLLVSIRRSLFSSDVERRRFLVHMMQGITHILETRRGLNDGSVYHGFCRLLGRLKASYQLSELVRVDGYSRWIELAAQFAVDSFSEMSWSANSVHYILCLWTRLVAAVPFVKMDTRIKTDPMLDTTAPRVVLAYIEARIDYVDAVIRGEGDDDLEDQDRVEEQLEQLPGVCRYQYRVVASGLTEIFDSVQDTYMHRTSSIRTLRTMGAAGAVPDENALMELRACEHKTAWIVYMISAIIGGQSFGSSSTDPEHVNIDADLCRRVLTLMEHVEMQTSTSDGAERVDPRLEAALLYFMHNFRKAYIGEQHGMPSPSAKPNSEGSLSNRQKLFMQLFEHIGHGTHDLVVSKIIGKMCSNLRYWVDDRKIIESTLSLFSEMAWTYSSGTLLLQLEAVDHLLKNHTSDHFGFLRTLDSVRLRTRFYTALARLLFIEDNPERFADFLAPILETLSMLRERIEDKSPDVMHAVIGVCRDLRGIAIATNNRRTYTLLFDQLYPDHMSVFVSALTVWADVPAVTTSVLKFMREFVSNRAGRIRFDSCSPNGLLLFREASNVLCAYGERIAGFTPDGPHELYPTKYKGIAISMSLLATCLDGEYVPFGVFELYGDPHLEKALQTVLGLALSIPMEDMLSFKKLGSAYYHLMQLMFRDHLKFLTSSDPSSGVFIQLIRSLQEGLDSLEPRFSMHAAVAVDCLAAYFVRSAAKAGRDTTVDQLHMHLSTEPSIFQELRNMLFEILVFSEVPNQWSLARPLLSLIVAADSVPEEWAAAAGSGPLQPFAEYQSAFISTQPEEVQERLAGQFEKLLSDVTRSLDGANRERFAQRLSAFRSEARTYIKFLG